MFLLAGGQKEEERSPPPGGRLEEGGTFSSSSWRVSSRRRNVVLLLLVGVQLSNISARHCGASIVQRKSQKTKSASEPGDKERRIRTAQRHENILGVGVACGSLLAAAWPSGVTLISMKP
ncbi:hypothetical protein EYF80_048367 [Liparis tanakae]|uniref:Uncharacterized protein n=1 Tax=Liparis tanakae TaxID=230148 RepID=A0A4Z2FKE2_9TELE|nr:hypothetical protein EYF80_048367 [Liparis tanakae]